MTFNPGDRVIVNGALVATIQTWDEENDRCVYVSTANGGTDTAYGPISQSRFELLTATPVTTDRELDEVRDGVTNTGPVQQTLPLGDEDAE